MARLRGDNRRAPTLCSSRPARPSLTVRALRDRRPHSSGTKGFRRISRDIMIGPSRMGIADRSGRRGGYARRADGTSRRRVLPAVVADRLATGERPSADSPSAHDVCRPGRLPCLHALEITMSKSPLRFARTRSRLKPLPPRRAEPRDRQDANDTPPRRQTTPAEDHALAGDRPLRKRPVAALQTGLQRRSPPLSAHAPRRGSRPFGSHSLIIEGSTTSSQAQNRHGNAVSSS
jgi:hypothetical protein